MESSTGTKWPRALQSINLKRLLPKLTVFADKQVRKSTETSLRHVGKSY